MNNCVNVSLNSIYPDSVSLNSVSLNSVSILVNV